MASHPAAPTRREVRAYSLCSNLVPTPLGALMTNLHFSQRTEVSFLDVELSDSHSSVKGSLDRSYLTSHMSELLATDLA